MTAVAGPSPVTPPDRDPGGPSVPGSAAVGPVLPDELVRSICPYLGTGAGWRLAVPERAHRCLAVSPAPQLALEKQARLCLTAAHEGCATFRAASAAVQAAAGDSLGDAPGGSHPRRRWSVPRTQATVLDIGRGSVDLRAIARQRSTAQVGLVLVALVAFAALIASRLSTGPLAAAAGPTDRPPVAASAASPTPSLLGAEATPTIAATPGPTVTPTPTPMPTTAPSATATAGPSSGPSPTPAASYRTYRVRAGDTLSAIAARFHTTVKALEAANGITDPTRLQIGQVLRIPS